MYRKRKGNSGEKERMEDDGNVNGKERENLKSKSREGDGKTE